MTVTMSDAQPLGPLAGVRILELAGIGPAPFAGMLLADMGADVVQVDRPAHASGDPSLQADVLARGRRSVVLDLKDPAGRERLLELAAVADVLIDPYRPGVLERLGLGPDVLAERNELLIIARMTGWGQAGPYASMAGHDINYVGLAGALYPVGFADRPPPPPLALVGDFGGGGMFLAFGILCALFERTRSGRGQVVDAAMVDGAAALTTAFHGMMAAGAWSTERESNLLDGGMPFYRCYRTADDRFVAVGALEPQFYRELLARLGLDPDDWPQHDRSRHPKLHRRLEEIFASATRDEWERRFQGSDACVTPVLRPDEVAEHPHVSARDGFITVGDVRQPAPAPRLSRTPGAVGGPPPRRGEHDSETVLAAWRAASP